MLLPLPSSFQPAFTAERLSIIADALLNLRYQTLREMQSPFDDQYTREVVVFGRSKNMLIQLALGSQYPWLNLLHAGMDVTIAIDGLPVRYFRDDPDHPEKQGFFKRNAYDDLFDPQEDQPIIFRFVVERAQTPYDEDQVHFVGFNVFQEKVCQWVYRGGISAVQSVNPAVPVAAELPPPVVDVRRDDRSDSADDAQASG